MVVGIVTGVVLQIVLPFVILLVYILFILLLLLLLIFLLLLLLILLVVVSVVGVAACWGLLGGLKVDWLLIGSFEDGVDQGVGAEGFKLGCSWVFGRGLFFIRGVVDWGFLSC